MKSLLDIFDEITQIPHCSFKTKKLQKYIKKFAKKNGFKSQIDKTKNILCYKNGRDIALQSHYDMVCMGDAPKIEIIKTKETLTAKNSSLGADNGIGVALMLYFMQTEDNFEALFTNDEEVGLIGVNNLELKLKAKKLINLDSEDEGAIFVGCAGGIEMKAFKKIKRKDLKKDSKFYKVEVTGMKGGHSGFDIDKNIESSIKVLANFLVNKNLKIIEMSGGEKMNSIPKEAMAIIASKKTLENIENIKITPLKKNYTSYIQNFKQTLRFLNSFKQGMRSYNSEFLIPKDSINLAIFKSNSQIEIDFFARSLSDLGLKNLKKETSTLLKLQDFQIKYITEFSAWQPEISNFAKDVKKISETIFKDSNFKAVHAGLEGGVLKNKFPQLQIISIGPNIHYPHSIREYCELKSVKKVTKLLKKILRKEK